MAESSESRLPFLVGETIKVSVLALQNYTVLLARAFAGVFTPPFYFSDTLEQMDVIGVGSLPIVLLCGFFIGAVMVLQTSAQFERFGETSLTGDVVAIALVRELGPTMTALLVAGRNASGIASEIGSMVITEQVDAMRAMGTDPIRKLVTPRLVATVLMLPLLTAVTDFIGMTGGYLVSYLTLHLSSKEFWSRAIQALEFGDLIQGLTKPVLFGIIVASVACYQGLNVRGGAQGVGRSTTSAVVVSSVFVLISNFFISRVLLFIFQK